MKEHEDTDARAAARDEREALLMRAGGLAFAVYLEEHECVTAWAEPAPLPDAPAPILGVVSVRGRMRTVIDPARLFETLGLGPGPGRPTAAYKHIASLAGDEQLALAFETSAPVRLTPGRATGATDAPALPTRAAFHLDGETVYLLDPARLFDAAMSGTERRRRRS